MSSPADRESARVPIWLVGKVQASMEFATAGRLRRQGVRVKCPGYIAIVRPARTRKPVKRVRAAYPGYVFIDRNSVVDLERVCLKTKGFMHLVSFDDAYCACDDETLVKAIEYKKKLERENFFGGMSMRVMKQKIKAGVLVKIKEGALRGFTGKVTQRRGNNVTLNVEIFGKDTPVVIEVADLVLQNA